MKYEVQIGKREHPSWDPKTGELVDYFKYVKVRTPDGRQKEFKVGMTILNSEEMWDKFRREIIEVWVHDVDGGILKL